MEIASSEVQISLKSIGVCIDSDDIGFLNTAGSLKHAKCFMVINFFYESTRYPKPVSTQSHYSQKLLVSTRYTPENSRGLHDINDNILKLEYHHPRMFVWAFRTKG